MVYGKAPYVCYRLEDLKRLQKEKIVFPGDSDVPDCVKELIQTMLTYDAKDRPDYEDLLRMEFFRDKENIEKNEDLWYEEYELIENSGDPGEITEKKDEEISEENKKVEDNEKKVEENGENFEENKNSKELDQNNRIPEEKFENFSNPEPQETESSEKEIQSLSMQIDS